MMISYVIILLLFCLCSCWEYALLGCYRNAPTQISKNFPNFRHIDECSNNCKQQYYRYSFFYHQECVCGNYLGEQVFNSTCDSFCQQNACDNTLKLTEAYETGNLVPGPPKNIEIKNVTETSCRLKWQEPESFIDIRGYLIKVQILRTFSNFPAVTRELTYSNNTFQADIIKLLPGTKYNISVSAISKDGSGASTSNIFETDIADPDNPPSQPQIVENDGTKITVKLCETVNNNGPVTAYLVVVINADEKQVFDKGTLLSYDAAKAAGITYYIAAEIDPKDINTNFVVGDGKMYRSYYNAPLDADTNYHILVGIQSKYNGRIRTAFSAASGSHNGVLILNVNDNSENDSPAVIISLSVAIVLLSLIFVIGVIGFIMLKSRVVNRRQRLSDNQELTLQGPMIEVENNGYIHDEDYTPPVTYYRDLKQKVRQLSSNQLKVEPTNLLGTGKYGKVNTGSLHENDNLTTVTTYTIYDKKMSQDSRKSMLQDLDVLIKSGKHENLIQLIGTMETSQMVIVAFEYAQLNLKDTLLGSRDAVSGRFSNMSELQALKLATDICKGMAHLHKLNIIHKQLCARSIYVTNGYCPKIGSYGIAQYFSHNKIPDYTRWTAVEVFKNNPHNPKSDVWSFACVFWEICALGGTPYGNVSNNELPDKLSKGLRLPQLSYMNDDLYQILLDCWQLDCDERPTFSNLIDGLINLKENTLIPFLNFNLYSSFQYEQLFPDMELAVRPVF